MMEIKTERLSIRKIIAGDWISIKRIWDDFRTSEYAIYDIPHKTKDEEVQLQVSKWAEANKNTAHMFFAVCLADEVIGYIDFHDTGHGYESGYCFHSDYHGKGYAKESYQALTKFFANMGVKRLTVGTATKNTPSVNLLRSLGFEQVGTERVSFYQNDAGDDIYFEGGIFVLNLAH